MSFADDAEFAAFIGRDEMLRAVSTEAVAIALKDFQPDLPLTRDIDWLAMAVRRSLAIVIPNERLASLVSSTWLELFQIGSLEESRLWDYAWQNWDGEGGSPAADGMVMGEPSEFKRFKAIVAELDWMATFIGQAARTTKVHRGPWRQSEEKQLRIERARYLAPIYEAAFEQPVTANNYPHEAKHVAPTPFMDFYYRMVRIAFGQSATTNYGEVVKAACQLHRQDPVSFAEGVIPGL